MKSHIISAKTLYEKEFNHKKLAIKKAAEITRRHIGELTIERLSEIYKKDFNREIIINNIKITETISCLGELKRELFDEITQDSMIIYSENDSSSIISIVHMLAHSLLHTNIIYKKNISKETFKDSYLEWFNYQEIEQEVDVFMKNFFTPEELEELLSLSIIN